MASASKPIDRVISYTVELQGSPRIAQTSTDTTYKELADALEDDYRVVDVITNSVIAHGAFHPFVCVTVVMTRKDQLSVYRGGKS